jgi:hypothetical protein
MIFGWEGGVIKGWLVRSTMGRNSKYWHLSIILKDGGKDLRLVRFVREARWVLRNYQSD